MVFLLELQIIIVFFILVVEKFMKDDDIKKWIIRILFLSLTPLIMVDLIELIIYLIPYI